MRTPTFASLLAAPLAAACSFSGAGTVDDTPGSDAGPPVDTVPACADDDRDSVCNAVDRCAAGDDAVDLDADGTPDACDDWPCGAVQAEDPGGSFDLSDPLRGRRWRANTIDIGVMRRHAVRPGAQFAVKFHWDLVLDCGIFFSCPAQLEYGYGSTRAGCMFDGNVGTLQFKSQDEDRMIAAPMTPGIYELRINAGRRLECGTGRDWHLQDPGELATIARICVQ